MTSGESPHLAIAGRAAKVGGVKWRDAMLRGPLGRPEPVRLLVPVDPGAAWRPVEIQETLFAEFSRLEATEAAVLEFSNRNCFLGRTSFGYPIASVTHDAAGAPGSGGSSLLAQPSIYGEIKAYDPRWFRGELLSDWSEEILRMRCAIDLAASLKGNAWVELGALVRVDKIWARWVEPYLYDGGAAGVIESTEAPVIAGEETRGEGRRLLQQMINLTLRKLTWVGVNLEDDRPRQQIFTDSLLATMWLQLLNSVTEGRISTCAMCSTLIIDPPEAVHRRRAAVQTCSARCRKRHSRKNLAERA